MRGRVSGQPTFFLTVNLESDIPADHPLRPIKKRADAILQGMRRDLDAAYSRLGRPSIPPEQLLKAMLLMALYSVRSEIQLMQQVHFNLLYRWFLDLYEGAAWTPEVFSMNRERFAEHGLVRKFFDRVAAEALAENLASREHFSVDGTLIESWASLKSVKPKDGEPGKKKDDDPGNPTVNFQGEKRPNETHASTTDPEARLARHGRGKEARLCHSAHVLMENRHGLIVDILVDAADGHAERRCALAMLRHVKRRHRVKAKTLGADAGYDDGEFLEEIESRDIVPHVPMREFGSGPKSESRKRAQKRMGTKGYSISQRIRKRVEEIFGWCKTVGHLAKVRLVGRWKLAMEALITGAAYNLLRMAKLKAV
jgi:transposase/IS5 family transposase